MTQIIIIITNNAKAQLFHSDLYLSIVKAIPVIRFEKNKQTNKQKDQKNQNVIKSMLEVLAATHFHLG